jgi:hypothetical protein
MKKIPPFVIFSEELCQDSDEMDFLEGPKLL